MICVVEGVPTLRIAIVGTFLFERIMYYFYVLYSLRDHKLNKGYSSDLGGRFIKHQLGGTQSTKHRRPLVLIYSEAYETKSEAIRREIWSKSKQGGPELKELLIQKGILNEEHRLELH